MSLRLIQRGVFLERGFVCFRSAELAFQEAVGDKGMMGLRSNRFQNPRVAQILFLLSLFCIVSGNSACVPVVASTVASHAISESVSKKRWDSYYFDQAQAFRMNSGLSLEEFDLEMWTYVPKQYSQFLEARLEAAQKCNQQVSAKCGNLDRNYLDKLMTRDRLRSLSKDIDEKKEKYSGDESFWDLESMAYRAIRLSSGASEAQIISELKHSDPKFDARYNQFKSSLSKPSSSR